MATKTDIQNAINTINDGGLNTAAEVRAVYEVFKDALYPTKITDSQSTTNVLTIDLADITYVLNLTKIGNLVSVSGRISNGTGAIISDVDLISITNTEYYPDCTALNPFYFTSGSNIFQITSSNKIKLTTSLGVGEDVYFNFSYKTVD